MASRPELTQVPDTTKNAVSGNSDVPQRPKSLTEFFGLAGSSRMQENTNTKKLTKLLLNVTIQRSLGAVQVVISPEKKVEDLIRVVLEIYVKEKRRPLLNITDARCFELHYSQFTLESLDRKEKLINLGSRNFFLFPKSTENLNSSCSDQAIREVAFTKFMVFML